MTAVIEIHGLTRKFGETVAVNGLTLSVNEGEIFGLLGHNGAGKTTTVRLLNGVLGPTSGSAKVLGLSPVDDGVALRRQTGVLTETPALYEKLNARENLAMFARLYGVPKGEIAGRVGAILTQFELDDRAKEQVGGYSKGMKQRLALARAFLHEPRLLFLDEPTAGLDPVAAKQVNDLIVALSREQGRTVVLATHNLHDAERICDRVAVLEHGRLLALGSPAELRRGLNHNTVLELEVADDDRGTAQAALAAHGYAANGTTEGRQLRVDDVPYNDVPGLVTALAGAGVRVYRVAPEAPTLEDVYFALHRGEMEDGQ